MLVFKHNNRAEAKNGLPPLPTIARELASKWTATEYLYHKGILRKPCMCPKCGRPSVSFKKDPFMADILHLGGDCDKGPSDFKACFIYRCKDRECNWQQSIYSGSFFAKLKKPINEVLMCLYFWLAGKAGRRRSSYST